MGPIPDGPGRSRSLFSGLCCRVPPPLDEFPNKLLGYRDDCISANDDVEFTDDDIELCSNDELSVMLRPEN